MKTKEVKIEVYDLEVYPNFFSYTGKNIITGIITQFVIDSASEVHKNQYRELLDHVLMLNAMIGFNNINYDYPILHFLINRATIFNNKYAADINHLIYNESQRIINADYSAIHESKVRISQIDLYRIYHFDNKNKRTSLKDIEIVMQFPKVEDLPYKFNQMLTEEQAKKVLIYNLNDVEATLEFYKRSIEKIKLRQELGKSFGLVLINHNDPKIGVDIFAKIITDETDITKEDLKYLRTKRDIIHLGECILPYVKYKSIQFNKFLSKVKAQSIRSTKGGFKESVVYKGFKYDFGTGGIHGCIKSGVYEADENNIIQSCDVTSLYPSLAIVNNFYPKHLGDKFIEIYNKVFKLRALAKFTAKQAEKEGNKDYKNTAINEGLKLALNGVYGKSNEEFSFFYDPKFTMRITVNGQLLLTMLAERITDAGFKMLMINTDGLECIVPKNKIDVYNSICKQWEEETKLSLEFDQYKKLIIRDVNNYIGVYTSDKVKYKGTFEIDKDYHKDPSNKIVSIALSEYFVKGIPIEKTIYNHTNVLDFCLRYKSTLGWRSELRTVNPDSTLTIDRCQKTNRYYVSNRGGTYLKIHEDGREEQIEAGWYTTILNIFDKQRDIKSYDINYNYYIYEANKIINVIENKQLELF